MWKNGNATSRLFESLLKALKQISSEEKREASRASAFIFQPSSTALASLCLWHGCVEKCGDHRGQPLGAVRKRHMRRAWEHGKLGTRQTDEIAYYASAKQAKHLDHVLRAHGIGVPNDEQGGRFD